jgi:hypothetical protein
MKAPFDWKRRCAQDLTRRFPAVVGSGRGRPLREVQSAKRDTPLHRR